MDLKNWPKYRVFEGRKCELQVVTMWVDGKEPPPRPEFSKHISASYRSKPGLWRKAETLGPGYTWTSDGQFLERAYNRSVIGPMQIYQYDRAGRLFGYSDRIHGTEEYFDADGSLIAGEYGRTGLWIGERVSRTEYVERRTKLFRDVRWRY